jgi:glycosyltransferase involved in cell wall biosynthesis
MDERIRVLLIIFSFDIESIGGGISRFAVSLSEALNPTEFQIFLCGLWNHGTQIEAERIYELNQAGIRAFTCAPWEAAHPYYSFVRSVRALGQMLKGNSIDIIHSHSLFGDIAALLLNFEGKAPIIIRTLHNEMRTEWSRRPMRRLLLTNLMYPLAFDVEIGVSQYITQNLNQRWLARKLNRQAITIHNALDINRFRILSHDPITIRREFNIPEDAYLVGSVGRLTRQKGYDLMLEAAAMAINKMPALYFIIIGDGEDANSLKHRAEELEIENRMIFTGSRPDVDALLIAMDLFVCSSRWEGLSTVLMEAMAAGIPILATDIPGNRELLQPGISGWFVPVENSNELAGGIIQAYQNPEQSKEFAKNARIKVTSFGIEEIANIHAQLYKLIHVNRNSSHWTNHKYVDEEINRQIGSN